MAEPTPPQPAEPTGSAKDLSATGLPASDAGTTGAALPRQSIKYLSDVLEKAELLLAYAAEAGIKIDAEVRDAVLKARFEKDAAGFTEPTASNLFAAFTTLAATVSPVTVEGLTAKPKEAGETIRFYRRMAIAVGLIILVISMITFVSNSISGKIATDVDTANGLAAKLKAELGPPPGTNQPPPDEITWAAKKSNIPWRDAVWYGPNGVPPGLADDEVLSDFQQFAATMREIDGRARELNFFLLNAEHDPFSDSRTNRPVMKAKLEFDSELRDRLATELAGKITVYQDVRSFGNGVQEGMTVWYGAIASCILPVLYALLGAGAYLLRMYEDQIRTRTLVAGGRHTARFLIAGIGGLVVGLFNNLTQGVTISPFAVAFLVGYAADVFFTFLEGMLQIFKRGPGSAGTPATPPKS